MQAGLARHAQELRARLTGGILPYWHDTAVDRRRGGFLLADDARREVAAVDKDLVAQSRLIWCFAHAHRAGLSGETRRDCLGAAAQGWRFLQEHFLDRTEGGYYWTTDLDGRPLDARKILYGQAFALYALVEYHRASGDSAPLAAAAALAEVLDARARDRRHRGWLEHFRRDWEPVPRGDRSAPIEVPGLKSANAHLHMMESLTELLDAAGDAGVRRLLEETCEVNARFFYPADPRAASPRRHPDWSPVLNPRSLGVSFGHNVQYAWLLLRAEEVLGRRRSRGLLHAYLGHALRCGFDHRRGGLFHAGVRDWFVYDRRKIWWVQAELLAALTAAIGDRPEPAYLAATERLLRFADDHLADPRDGIWIQATDARGRPLSTVKAGNRKAGYHEVRAFVKFIAAFGPAPPGAS